MIEINLMTLLKLVVQGLNLSIEFNIFNNMRKNNKYELQKFNILSHKIFC